MSMRKWIIATCCLIIAASLVWLKADGQISYPPWMDINSTMCYLGQSCTISGGSGTISSITSTGSTIAVTGGTGPTANVDVNLANNFAWTGYQTWSKALAVSGGVSGFSSYTSNTIIVQGSDTSFIDAVGSGSTLGVIDLRIMTPSAGTVVNALETTDNAGDWQMPKSLTLAATIAGGTKFTVSGCSATTTVGGASAGQFDSGTTGTCTVTITFNGATGLTAPNGWYCAPANDFTTPADSLKQTASTTTTATLSGTTVSGDVINFGCTAY
ncbi:MAG: hypothetical protein WA213_21050 [Terriglobales bacterium]